MTRRRVQQIAERVGLENDSPPGALARCHSPEDLERLSDSDLMAAWRWAHRGWLRSLSDEQLTEEYRRVQGMNTKEEL